jgi:DNA-binding NarL/FixJ family response regulator
MLPACNPVTVLIVDDHTVAREGLRSVLKSTMHIRVVGEARNGLDACTQAAVLHPTVILMDLKMPVLDGLEATRRIKAERAAVSIIMMTSYDDEAIVLDALRAGASGYLVKDSTRELLVHTILAVAHGGVLLQDALFQRAFRAGTVGVAPTDLDRRTPEFPGIALQPLSVREQAIVRLIADGMTNRSIAETLSFAEVTIKKHVQSIIARLSASDRTQAAVTALRLGLID